MSEVKGQGMTSALRVEPYCVAYLDVSALVCIKQKKVKVVICLCITKHSTAVIKSILDNVFFAFMLLIGLIKCSFGSLTY